MKQCILFMVWKSKWITQTEINTRNLYGYLICLHTTRSIKIHFSNTMVTSKMLGYFKYIHFLFFSANSDFDGCKQPMWYVLNFPNALNAYNKRISHMHKIKFFLFFTVYVQIENYHVNFPCLNWRKLLLLFSSCLPMIPMAHSKVATFIIVSMLRRKIRFPWDSLSSRFPLSLSRYNEILNTKSLFGFILVVSCSRISFWFV